MPRTCTFLAPPRLAAAGGILALAFCLSPGPAAAQSFNCAAATYPDEMMVCSQPGLARLDEQLAMLFRLEFNKLDKDQREAFQSHETMFVQARRRCRENTHCIEQSYRNRIRELRDMLSDNGGEQPGEATGANDREPDRRATHNRSGAGKEPAGVYKTEQGEMPRSAPVQPDRTTAVAPPPPPAPPPVPEHTVTTGETVTAAPSRHEHRTQRHERKTAAAPAAPATTEVEPSRPAAAVPEEPVRPTASRHERRHKKPPAEVTAHQSEPSQPAAPPPATGAQAGETGSSTKPAIRWVDPPPAR